MTILTEIHNGLLDVRLHHLTIVLRRPVINSQRVIGIFGSYAVAHIHLQSHEEVDYDLCMQTIWSFGGSRVNETANQCAILAVISFLP